jgi:hypothetical protein
MNPARWSMVILLTLAAAFHSSGQEKEQTKEYTNKLYPIGAGYRWHYRVTDLKAPKSAEPAAKQQVIVTAGTKQVFTLKKKVNDEPGKNEQVYGYELEVQGSGKPLLEQVLVSDDGVYRVSGAGKLISPPLCILKANAVKGMTWKCDSQSENAVIKGEFVVDQQDVELPVGTLTGAIVVQSRDFYIGTQKMQVTTWYKENLGMVKQHVQVGNHDVILELEKFEPK